MTEPTALDDTPPRSTAQIHASFPSASFLRRLAAMVYDLLVAVAILMLATGLALILPAVLNHMDVIQLSDDFSAADWLNKTPLFGIYLLSILAAFFCWFWWRSGQTVGMRAWRLKVQQRDGSRLTKKQAVIRVLTCAFGLGNLWVLVDFKNRRAWHDYAANTELVTLSKEANQLYYWKEL
ncbi:RDD family protein [Pseudidiomarina sp.]|uniref:RDD family protein n=1 Tax=Pseudidiomarina sp. TaxID=2081707 RepID=UPI003A98350F